MSEIITVSSDEEDVVSPSPKKRIKPTQVGEVSLIPIITKNPKDNSEDVVVLSDEDDHITEKIKKTVNSDLDNEYVECNNVTATDDDNDSVTFIDENNEKTVINGKNEGDNSISDDLNKDDVPKIECSIIVDEHSSEESSGKENKSENISISPPSEPSTSAESDNILEKFLNVCGENITNSQYEHLKNKQFPIIRKYYKKCGGKLRESSNFLKLIEENIDRAKKSPAAAVISFNEVFQYIKELIEAESIEVSEENRIKLKKLEKTIKLLVIRIKHLENSDINFDAEEDSTYLQLDRYINRLNKVYEKYCQLLKKNPHSGRITYEKLDFVDSEYNEINRAINKKYKNNKFPSYIEIEEYIKKIVAEHNLDLSEAKIKSESVRCFKKLAELLQSRRKKELYDAHYLYIRDSEDPAGKDVSLDSTLKQNYADGLVKIEKLCEEYVTKEEQGEEPVLSEEDSDKSNYVDSENENEDEN